MNAETKKWVVVIEAKPEWAFGVYDSEDEAFRVMTQIGNTYDALVSIREVNG
jgi:hypothetical protein